MRLRDLFTGRKNRGEDQPAPAPLHLNRYPPDDPGIDAISPQQMLDDQKALLVRIERALGIPDNEYDPIFPPMFVRLASFMHLLPASRERHHARIGGLFRHSLEVGLYTLEGVEGNDLTAMMQGTPQKRRNQRPRWRGAALMAGLVHDIAKVYTDLSVIDRAGRTWSPHYGGLYDWLAQNKIDRYYIEYRAQRQGNHEALQGAFVDQVITREFAHWLDEYGGDIYLQFRMCISGQVGHQKLHELVANADQRSVSKDIKIHKGLTGPGLGVSQAQQVVDVMRRLIHESQWQVNRSGGRLWIIGDGGTTFAHIAWQKGYEEILKASMRDKNVWLPAEPSTMAEMLIERGIAEPFVDEGGQSLYWPVKGVSKTGKTLYTLRVPADVLFPDLIPPLSQCYVADGEEETEQLSAGEDTGRETQGQASSANGPDGSATTTPEPQATKNPEVSGVAESDAGAGAEAKQGGAPAETGASQGGGNEASASDDGEDRQTAQPGGPESKKPPKSVRVDREPTVDEEKYRRAKAQRKADGATSKDRDGANSAKPETADPGPGAAVRDDSEKDVGAKPAAGATSRDISPDDARAWLERHSKGSREVLMPWFDAITTGSKKVLAEQRDRRLEIQWPEAAKGIGAPKDILVALEQMGALDTSGGVGGKVTRKPSGQMVVVIKPNVTRKLLAMGATTSDPQSTATPVDTGGRPPTRPLGTEQPSEITKEVDGNSVEAEAYDEGDAQEESTSPKQDSEESQANPRHPEGDEFRRALRAALPEIATRSEDGAFFLVTLKGVQEWNELREKPLRAYMVLAELTAIAESEKRGKHFAIRVDDN